MLKNLTDENLCQRLDRLVRHERKVMARVIEHIAEMERRKLHLALGYASLFDYLTKRLGYSESSAYRRMQAARALLQVPEIKPRLEEGSLKLSQVCLVQKTLRQEEKVSRERISGEKRKEIFAQVAGKTGRETEKILDAQIIHSVGSFVQEKHKRDESVELNLRLPKELYEKLRKIKELYAHIEPGVDWVKLLDLMAEDVIKKRDLLAKKPAVKKPTVKKTMTRHFAKTRMIPAQVKREILLRDERKCQFVGADGRPCESRHLIEIDHIQPVHRGGGNSPENLRVLCRNHNQFRFWREIG